MTQNTSHAVMSQRHEAHDSLDLFPTPPWATRALCEWLRQRGIERESTVWECACGFGDMARPLAEYFAIVRSTDVQQHGAADGLVDFLLPWPNAPMFDWIVTNPPFRLGQAFATTALQRARVGVALLVRTAFLESAERYVELFSHLPPSDILQFVERVPMFKGRLDRKGSTATAYCWLVWRKQFELRELGVATTGTTEFHWIRPCRKRLERDSDYPSDAA
jgi:hypothetical protein